MGNLIYSPIASLDGYVEDAQGKFDWAAPDEEVHAFVNDLERSIGTYLYGRRMYETMVFWETAGNQADEPSVFYDYAEIWRAAEKIVYSRTLKSVSSARTRLEPEFDHDAIRRRWPATTGRSGGRRRRSSTPGRCRRCRAREPESSASSTLRRSNG